MTISNGKEQPRNIINNMHGLLLTPGKATYRKKMQSSREREK